MDMKLNVSLHIERLVLDSTFAHLDRDALGAAVEAELARLLTEGGAPLVFLHDARIPRLDGGSFDVAPGAGTEAVGKQVAQHVYGGLAP